MSDLPAEPFAPRTSWIRNARTRTYRKGETIIRAGTEVDEWIAISGGAACLETLAAANVRVAVATLWFGDVLGCGSPLGQRIASYDVTAIGDVETIAIPHASASAQATTDTAHLYLATSSRLNRQIAIRLAGNGPQRLVSVLATLGEAFTQGSVRSSRPPALVVPLAQACLGRLAGLSSRQVWRYLGELARAGWVQTTPTRVVLRNLRSWQFLHAEVDHRGLGCIATIDESVATLASLLRRSRLP